MDIIKSQQFRGVQKFISSQFQPKISIYKVVINSTVILRRNHQFLNGKFSITRALHTKWQYYQQCPASHPPNFGLNASLGLLQPNFYPNLGFAQFDNLNTNPISITAKVKLYCNPRQCNLVYLIFNKPKPCLTSMKCLHFQYFQFLQPTAPHPTGIVLNVTNVGHGRF